MRSMTGCGTGRSRRNGWDLTVELKTVNHRFLDISLRLPKEYLFLEQIIRKRIPERMTRGHIDVFLSVRNTDETAAEVSVNLGIARSYLSAAQRLAEETGLRNDLSVGGILVMDGVLVLKECGIDQQLMTELCAEALDEALNQVVAMRDQEGIFLKEDLCGHLNRAEEIRKQISLRTACAATEYMDRLRARLALLIQDEIDPQRLAAEAAIMADRYAVDEELSRLDSHIQQMRQYLDRTGEAGKRMDFLIQEMNRETNTIGSKACDADVAQYVVDLKCEIEKLREQVQNVE